jgi:uncharacterized membrane protein
MTARRLALLLLSVAGVALAGLVWVMAYRDPGEELWTEVGKGLIQVVVVGCSALS